MFHTALISYDVIDCPYLRHLLLLLVLMPNPICMDLPPFSAISTPLPPLHCLHSPSIHPRGARPLTSIILKRNVVLGKPISRSLWTRASTPSKRSHLHQERICLLLREFPKPRQTRFSPKVTTVNSIYRLIRSAAQKFVPLGFTSAKEVFAQRQQIVHVTTGSKEVDKLLGGISKTLPYQSSLFCRWY